MPIFTSAVTYPNQSKGTGDTLADVTEQFTGLVEGSIKRKSIMSGFVPVRSVRGTAVISKRGISSTTLSKITAGEAPSANTKPNTSKITLRVDTVVIARNAEPMLDEFQVDFDYQGEVAREQGQAIANMYDETFFIMAAKAALLTESIYGSAAAMPGHSGGNVVTFDTATDYKDPAKLYAGIAAMVEKFLAKDVRPNEEDFILVLPPAAFTALMQADYIVNGEYVTSAGEKLHSTYMFAAWGVPVVTSNNAVFGKTITGHLLSNAANSNAYDGNFTKVVGQMFSPRALLAGSTIPVTSDIFFDKLSKLWFIDSWLAFAVGPDRAEYAGVFLIP